MPRSPRDPSREPEAHPPGDLDEIAAKIADAIAEIDAILATELQDGELREKRALGRFFSREDDA